MHNGHLDVFDPPDSIRTNECWIVAPNGGYYECHDYGNLAVMFPAA